jgi:hypothetical protein
MSILEVMAIKVYPTAGCVAVAIRVGEVVQASLPPNCLWEWEMVAKSWVYEVVVPKPSRALVYETVRMLDLIQEKVARGV